RLLPRDRPALAAREPHPYRQGGAGGLDESARRHIARTRASQHLCRGLGDLRHPGRHRRRAARNVPRGLLLQRRAAHRERVLDRGAGWAGQRVRFADRRLRGRLSRDVHGLPGLAGLPHHSGAAAAGHRDVYSAARPAREAMSVANFFKSRLFFIALGIVIIAATLPLYVSGYILGLLTVAYYFGVFAMAWDLLFGFAGEVNFGPTFLI